MQPINFTNFLLLSMMSKTLRSLTVFAAILVGSCGSDGAGINYSTNNLPNTVSTRWEKYQALEVLNDQPYSDIDTRLTFDFFKPDALRDKVLPLVVFAHPGAFVFGNKGDYATRQLCKDFTRAGFATASINYRKINFSLNNISEKARKRVIMEAVADARRAILYFKEHHTSMGIDPENIHFVGYSAGGIIANHLVFSNEDEVAGYVHDGKFTEGLFEIPSNELIKSAVSISGGIMDERHIDDRDLDSLRLLLIHGTKDGIVPFGKGRPFNAFIRDVDISIAELFFELGLSFQENGIEEKEIIRRFSIKPGVRLPAGFLKGLRNLLVSDDICGSSCIAQSMRSNKNIRIIPIIDAPHSFMLNKDSGILNETYGIMREQIYFFIESSILKIEGLQ